MRFPLSKLWKKSVAEAPSYDKIGAAQALLEEVRLEGIQDEIKNILVDAFRPFVLKMLKDYYGLDATEEAELLKKFGQRIKELSGG